MRGKGGVVSCGWKRRRFFFIWPAHMKSFLVSGQLINSTFKMSMVVDCRRNSSAEIDKPAVLRRSCYHDFLLIKHTKPNRKRTISKTTVSATEARKPSKCVYKVKWRKFCEHSGREWRVLYIWRALSRCSSNSSLLTVLYSVEGHPRRYRQWTQGRNALNF